MSHPKKLVRIIAVLLTAVLLTTVPAIAQQTRTAEEEAAYTRSVNQRAEKIVQTLAISEAGKAGRVRDIIAKQYRNLGEIHDASEARINLAEQQAQESEKKKEQKKAIEDETTARLDKLHAEYLSALSVELTPEQIEGVKNGMTYGVLPITYAGYLDMLPDLNEEQKKQIMTWLVEAREHAMDAGSSEKKHWWFGKYKGRINNYLSAAGYDMKKAGEEWQKRIKARAEKS
jgi:hypothetical protein